MGILSVLFSTARWNNDPNSKELARLILEAGNYSASGGAVGRSLDVRKMVDVIHGAGWSRKEAKNRIVHAVSMIKPVADKEAYEAARELCREIYVSL